MTDGDEYRFDPEDFDENGEMAERAPETNPAPLVIVGSLAAGIGLFVMNAFVEPVDVLGTELRLRTLSAFVFAIGLLSGGGIYVRRGKRLLGTVHAVAALGWALLAVGAVVPIEGLFAAGAALLVVGAVALVALTVRSVS